MRSILRKKYFWLIVACFVFVLLRFPSLIEPNWYGDEGIYQVVGNALNDGRMLYQEIWDNKPPLLYIVYALSNSNLYTVKLLSLISGLISIVSLYYLSLKLFKNKLSTFVTVILFAVLFGSPILEGNIANAENFMLLPTITSAFFVLKYSESKKIKYLLFAGLMLSISLIFKIVAVFDFLAFLTFLIIINGKPNKQQLKDYSYFSLSLLLFLILSALYFLINGVYTDFVQAVFVQNLSYVGEENSFIFPMGILFLKTFLLLVSISFLWFFSKRATKQSVLIYSWVAFGIYSAFFSDRPYTHYLLVLLPSFCLIAGNLFEKKKSKIIEVILLCIIVIIAFFHFQIYKKTLNYYGNFFDFVTNRKSIVDYETFFDRNTPRDYTLAGFITSNIKEKDGVFLWSDSPQIYALSNKLPIGKYIVAYHIKFYDNADIITKEQIESAKPKYIIQTATGPNVNDILSSYQLKYIIDGAKIYERQI